MIRSAHRLVIAVLVAALWLPAGCGERDSSIELETISMPKGGSIQAVASVTDGEDTALVAPTPTGLYRLEDQRWRLLDPRWPDDLPEQFSAPLRALGNATSSLNFPHAQAFTAHEDRLWMALGVPGTDGMRLLTSEDAGDSWSTVPLPDRADEGAVDVAGEDEDESDALVPPGTDREHSGRPRLFDYGEDGLYLTDGARLWHLDGTPNDSEESPFEPVSLSEVEWEEPPESQSLPSLLRHYVPASDARPFETATVLRDELFVFRRSAPSKPWRQVAALESADRQLIALPDSDRMVMLTSQDLYLSDDEGTTWENISPPDLGSEETGGVVVEALPVDEESPPVLLLAADNGVLYRSENLGGDWEEVRGPDGDRGVITDLAHSELAGRVYASTGGAGILRSPDGGRNWHTFNDGLEAARPYDIAIDDNETLLLGSDAGLYRLIGRPDQDDWQMLQDRASTTVYAHGDDGVIVVGTTTGGLIRLEANGQSTVAEADPEESGEVIYQPARLRGLELPSRAVAAIEARPDSRHIYAWTLEAGPRISVDGGKSWTHWPLNDAFVSALGGSTLSAFATDFGQRVYLVSRSQAPTAPTQLWRSYNEGETWHAVASFDRRRAREALFVERNEEYSPEVLFMADGNRVAKSLDGGNSWRDLPGPWEEGQVLQYDVRGRVHHLVVDQRHSLLLVRLTNTDDDHPEVTTYELEWSEAGPPRDDLRALAVDDERVYVTTSSSLLTGELPSDQPRLPDAVALMATLTSTFMLIALAYLILRWMGRD